MHVVLFFLIAFVILFLVSTYLTHGLVEMLMAATMLAFAGAIIAFFVWVVTRD